MRDFPLWLDQFINIFSFGETSSRALFSFVRHSKCNFLWYMYYYQYYSHVHCYFHFNYKYLSNTIYKQYMLWIAVTVNLQNVHQLFIVDFAFSMMSCVHWSCINFACNSWLCFIKFCSCPASSLLTFQSCY